MKSKSTAAVLALFLGGLGIHRFYLGQPVLGIIYLLLSFTLIPSILGLIDFFVLVIYSNEAFNKKYQKDISKASSLSNENLITITVEGPNPQTDDAYSFYDFVENNPTTHVGEWAEDLTKRGYKFKTEYQEAINEKVEQGVFINPLKCNSKKGVYDCIAIDFETANNSRLSACAIGLAFINEGNIVKTEKQFIKPPRKEYFLESHSKIHGITQEMVESAPDFKKLWNNSLSQLFNGCLIIFHNASMDLSILKNLFSFYEINDFGFEVLDTMQLAEWAGFEKRLVDLADRFKITFSEHHDPEIDAKVCAQIFFSLITVYPNYETLIKQINPSVLDEKPSFVRVSKKVQDQNTVTVNKYAITEDELNTLVIKESGFVFTGDLPESREECANFITIHGGLIKTGITSKVNYVVVGTDYGWMKIQKIDQLNSNKNCSIRILNYSDFQKLKRQTIVSK